MELCQEVLTIEHAQLPLSFLLNRILNTLPNNYFEFKSVLESTPYEQRTAKALTEKLCLLERSTCDSEVVSSIPGRGAIG